MRTVPGQRAGDAWPARPRAGARCRRLGGAGVDRDHGLARRRCRRPRRTAAASVCGAARTAIASTSSSGDREAATAAGHEQHERPRRATRSAQPATALVAGHLDAAGPQARVDQRRRCGGAAPVPGPRRSRAPPPAASGNPTRRVSGCRSTPAWRVHPAPHLDHQRPDVGGPPALVGLDEVGVLGRHLGGADAQALAARRRRSAGRRSRPAGLVNTDPALRPPGWWSRRHRVFSLMAAAGRPRGRPGRARQLGPDHHLAVGAPTRCGTRGRAAAAGTTPSSPDARSTTRTLTSVSDMSALGHAGVHAHGAADRAGHADGPLEPGEPGGRGLAGDHRQLGPGAGAHGGAVDGHLGEGGARARGPGRGSRRRPPAGWSPGPRPGRAPARCSRERLRPRGQGVVVGDHELQRRRARRRRRW